MTFCVKCHDINLMTLGRWHSTKSQLLVKMKENNHNTCVVYLLNDIDGHFHLIEIFLACLKINMKHSQNIDVETCRVRPVTSQCTKCCSLQQQCVWKQSHPMKRFDTSVANRKCHHNVTGVSGTQFQQCWHFVDIHVCANVMSWHYWTILVGQGPGLPFRALSS